MIPVVLFAYARPSHLRRTLDCLRENAVPKIIAFSDAPKTPAHQEGVLEVRRMLRAIDWTEVELTERRENLGLGVSIRTGVEEALRRHEAVIVFEDDLACTPGAYAWMCAALEAYRDEPKAMSVTGWTHPRVTPAGVAAPYFDGRAECWTWGTWRRSWQGMDRSAAELVAECDGKGIDPYRYGADLMRQAAAERRLNIWAVRWLYHHLVQGGLCLRPPRSMVDHFGLGAQATNAGGAQMWSVQPSAPPAAEWPPAVENPECARLWHDTQGGAGPLRRAWHRLKLRQ